MPNSAWPRKTRRSVKEGRNSLSSPLPLQPHGLALKQSLEALGVQNSASVDLDPITGWGLSSGRVLPSDASIRAQESQVWGTGMAEPQAPYHDATITWARCA